ncbi:MAG: hypothetical protein ABI405_13455 [Parafilimonas sp.]
MKLIKSFALVLISAATICSTAQAGNNNNKDKKNHQKEGKKVPIDGGISLLFVAGAAFGVKKVLGQKNEDAAPSEIA